MTRLVIETPCEECGECHEGVIYRWDGDEQTKCEGSGGSRTVLTDLHSAAALRVADERGVRENGHNLNSKTLQAIIDAALFDPERASTPTPQRQQLAEWLRPDTDYAPSSQEGTNR